MSSTSRNDSPGRRDLPVRLPVTIRDLADKMRIRASELIAELRFEMSFNAYSISMELPADVVTEVGRRFGFEVRFIKRGQ